MALSDDTIIGGLPIRSPDRPASRRRPIGAYRRFRLLLADKEDTEQVFHIGDALSGPHFERRLKEALETEQGYALAERHESLIPFFDDHEKLARLPEGSLGRAYLAFMQREGLTAKGLEEEDRKFRPRTYPDIVQWHDDRLRDLHDLIHVFTGYSRGALGELCNLAFTYGVNRGGLGDWFIAFLGTLEMKRWFGDLPIRKAFKEAINNGRAAKNFYLEDIEALFALPLEEAKAKLNIAPAPIYELCREAITERTEPENDPSPYGAVASG